MSRITGPKSLRTCRRNSNMKSRRWIRSLSHLKIKSRTTRRIYRSSRSWRSWCISWRSRRGSTRGISVWLSWWMMSTRRLCMSWRRLRRRWIRILGIIRINWNLKRTPHHIKTSKKSTKSDKQYLEWNKDLKKCQKSLRFKPSK